MEFTFAFCLFATCHSEMAMNPSSSQRASWSTLSRRRDKPWRITDQKAPSPGLRMLVTKTACNSVFSQFVVYPLTAIYVCVCKSLYYYHALLTGLLIDVV